jgi:peptide/nickel transport system ATP-binding protein
MSATAAAPILTVDDLVVEYQRKGQSPLRAVDGVSLDVRPGEVLGVVGESGCGKSTLARSIVAIAAPKEGAIVFDGVPVTPLKRRRRPAAQISLQMVFQDPYASLNPRRRVGLQVAEALRASAAVAGRALGGSAQIDRDVAELLERVGLSPNVASRYPHEFSGGQRQRIAIARVLATRPRMIVADEPVSALDASAQAQIANLLSDITRADGIALALISHDLAVVGAISDRVVVMYLGEIVEQGPTIDVWAQPRHPYTQALLAAIPIPDGSGRRPVSLRGEVPDPSNPPAGCRFHPRCPLATDRCRTQAPPDVALDGGRVARCWETERTA